MTELQADRLIDLAEQILHWVHYLYGLGVVFGGYKIADFMQRERSKLLR